jgi:bifunctional enzyme CysN/CysC
VAPDTVERLMPRPTAGLWHALAISQARRAGLKQQQPCCVWLTGLSGAGKSSIANALERRLFADGVHTYLLDGDNLRQGLNQDLGFDDADRAEVTRRVAEVARLMVDAGLVVLTSLISPFHLDRDMARQLFDSSQFVEVFVDTPLAICEQRDPKGLYKQARAGAIKNFTGLDSPYETPTCPDVHVLTVGRSIDECADQIFTHLAERLRAG